MSIADVYLRMLNEAKKEKELDPVDKKELKKDFDDREDGDIDNDGDTDKSDEYLHNKRKAVSKAMKQDEQASCGKSKKEAIEIDPDDGEVSKKKVDDKKKSKKGEEDKVDMNEATQGPKADEQEKLEPRAKGEKDFVAQHDTEVALDVNKEIDKNVAAAKGMKAAPKRAGDNPAGDKMKTFKDIRK